MNKPVVTLTNTPQLISTKGVYAQSKGGSFNFAFSSTQPTNLANCFTDTKVLTDGTHGSLWAWKTSFQDAILIVSEAV